MKIWAGILFFVLVFPRLSYSYAVFSHEAIIDATWDESILPLLKEKFPGQDDSMYSKAKAYTYGGAIMPDMGFFPFGAKFFTNLVHYVRTNDFVTNLLSEAKDLNEYAFALGSLAHYCADCYGHPLGVNQVVPLIYPKDEKEFGNHITYVNDPINHRRVEFAFDVLQIARGNYEIIRYRNFIGFEISKPLLERAFLKTYGIKLGDVFGNFDLAVASLRISVRNLFPILTKEAWMSKKDEIQKGNPQMVDTQFIYQYNRREYTKTYGKTPFMVSVTAGVIFIFPKFIGPARVLRFEVPGAEAESVFINSFDTVITQYRKFISLERSENLALLNLDFDTGKGCAYCEYSLANSTHLKWIKKLRKNESACSNYELEQSAFQFYNYKFDSTADNFNSLYKKVRKDKTSCEALMAKGK